ncbi:MAG: HD domain-containing protein [Acidaminococcaceae bacterium]|nr:HD domain-containing protein [Acidaminococcaceae bacterium]
MLSIPQYLDFAYTGKTKEICSFFLDLLQRKSEVLYLHSQQVANYSASVAAKLGLSRKEIGIIRTAALMHDIGLLSVPNSILNKFPYLSTRELAQYKRHCVAGCSMLENMEEFAGIIDLIRSHHEKWDGTGYPKRLKGVNIPLGARIIAVADYYDSVINPCSTKWQKNHQEALQELLSGMGTAFDPEIVKAFMEAIAPGNTIKPVPVYAKKGSPKQKSKTAAERIAETPAKSIHTAELTGTDPSGTPVTLVAEQTGLKQYNSTES